MAILDVRLYGDPILRRRAEPVPSATTAEIETLLDDMVETMYDQVGIGLAAPQVGIGLRIFTLDDLGTARAFFNPTIVEQGGRVTGEEGCLSLPGFFSQVARAEWVVVEAQDRSGASVRQRASGLLARVFQHEIDHLAGILFIDRLDKVARDRIKRRIKKDGFREGASRGALAL